MSRRYVERKRMSSRASVEGDGEQRGRGATEAAGECFPLSPTWTLTNTEVQRGLAREEKGVG